jgi:polygalacturonase
LIKDINFDEGDDNIYPKSSKRVIEASRHSPLMSQATNKD